MMGTVGNRGLGVGGTFQVPVGATVVNKFGRSSSIDAIDPEVDVWLGNSLYPFPAAPVALEILSDDAADDKDTGTGARSVELEGLDENWLLKIVTVELEGLTPVNLPGLWIRPPFRKQCIDVGSGGVNAGLITTRTQGGAGTDYAFIEAGEGQTLMAVFAIPADKIGKLFRHWATFDRNISGTATIHLMVRKPGESWQNKQAFTVGNAVPWDFSYEAGGIELEPMSDVRMEVVDVSSNSTIVDAGFDLWYRDA